MVMMASRAAISSGTSTSSSNSSLYLDEKWKLSKREISSKSARSSASFLSGNSSNKRCAFSRKCARLVKEQRAKFYIMRRCVVMLICWRDYGDS